MHVAAHVMPKGQADPAGPLSGITVLDLTRNLAGPFCTMTLADLGARVIKIEHPDGGDDTRHWSPPAWGTESATFLSANRNKESVAIDFSRKDGVALVRRLAARADVLVESFRPGSLAARELGWDDLHALNSRLVYCSITAFGSEGPRQGAPGYDPVIQAFTGIMELTGWPDGPPARLGVAAIDLGAAMWATIGIQGALSERATTGRGSKVDTSLLETATWWLSYHLGGYFASEKTPQRSGTAAGFIAPYETYATADGELMIAAGNDRLFENLAVLIDAPELLTDDRFATNPQRVAHRHELNEILGRKFAQRSACDWEAILDGRVPCSRVRTIAEYADDQQLGALQLVTPLPMPAAPTYRAVNLPVTIDGRRAVRWHAAPRLGQHTHEVLGEFGVENDELEQLTREGTIA